MWCRQSLHDQSIKLRLFLANGNVVPRNYLLPEEVVDMRLSGVATPTMAVGIDLAVW